MGRGIVEGRRRTGREPRKIIFALCEGRETEPNYLAGFKESLRGRASLRIFTPNEKDPEGLVRAAKRKFERYEIGKDDCLWILFDADRNSQEQISAAIKQARMIKARIAFSNPCFELWYLLHYEDRKVALSAKEVSISLSRHLPGYEKNQDYFDILAPRLEEALKRAEDLEIAYETPFSLAANPSTGVWRLVRELQGYQQ